VWFKSSVLAADPASRHAAHKRDALRFVYHGVVILPAPARKNTLVLSSKGKGAARGKLG